MRVEEQEAAPSGYWAINEDGDFEYRHVKTEKVLETMPFAKARSLAAFFMWQFIESVGE